MMQLGVGPCLEGEGDFEMGCDVFVSLIRTSRTSYLYFSCESFL